ncbi:MAG: PstS family phosphate ABC transporter substrate-binding protein [Rhodanobacteraceae bacterium]
MTAPRPSRYEPCLRLGALVFLSVVTTFWVPTSAAGGHATRAGATVPAGGLRCVGASTMQSLLKSWATAFRKYDTQALIVVATTTRYSAAGVTAVLAGRANCISFAREPFPAEVAALKRRLGHAPIVVPVAGGSYATPHGTFALAIYVNRANPLRGLSLPALAALFSGTALPGQQKATTSWGQLGLRGQWAMRPIHLYGMTPRRTSGNPPGIVNFLDQRVLDGRAWRRDLRVRVDTARTSALAAIVQSVGNDPDGIGYSGFGYANAGVRAVPLAAKTGAPYVAGTPAAVAAARYPLSREIYLGFPRTDEGRLTPLACQFLSFILGADGQRMIARSPMRFVPLTAAQDRHARHQLAQYCAPTSSARNTTESQSRPAFLDGHGAIRIVGYNDMRWMLQGIDRRFTQTHPGIHFALVLRGTRTAPAALADGRSLFAPMGAEFSHAERIAYRRRTGSDPLEFRVAHAALNPRARSSPLAIYVNRANPLASVSMAQLRRTFTGSTPLTKWSQLGLKGAWTHQPIHPCGLAPATALGRYMRLHHFGGHAYTAAYAGFAESSDVIRHVAVDPDSLCFADLNQADEAVRVVAIRLAQGVGTSAGSRADIISGRYPLDRYLYIYTRSADESDDLRVLCPYLRLVLSTDGQQIIASTRPGYLPLSTTERTEEERKLDALLCKARV